MGTLHVVIPYYNEAATVGPCLRRVIESPLPEGWVAAIVLVDDHSHAAQQRAAEAIARELRAAGRTVSFRRHDVNRGKGAAVQTAFDLLLADQPPPDDLVVIQDADLEYDPSDYPGLMRPLLAGDADAVIGTRWADRPPQRTLVRRIHALGNRALTILSNLMTGYRLTDMECCYKMVSVALLRRLRPHLRESRYGIEPQMVAALARLGARVTEIPVAYDPRTYAQGKKIGWTDGLRAAWVIGRERLRRRSGDGGA